MNCSGKSMMNEIASLISRKTNILILSHKRPDGDSICSQAALYLALKKAGMSPYILNQDNVPEMFQFLQADAYFMTEIASFIPELIIYLDSANRSRIGEKAASCLEQLPSGIECINIDHHASNDYFCTYNYVHENASSTCEIIFNLLKAMHIEIDQQMATLLLTGIITDTGFFKFGNVGPETLVLASQLLERGADMKLIAREVYMNRPIEKMHLISAVIERMTVIGDTAFSYINANDFKKTGSKNEYTDGIVNQMLYIRGIEAAVLVIEDNGSVRISFRSKGSKYDMNSIASRFGGGGHINAAGAYMRNISIEDAVKRIKQALESL